MPPAASTAIGAGRRRQAGERPAAQASRSPIEQRILLTATLCLLALGMVMVYSASSASGVLEGGSGGGYLIRFAIYGGVGLIVMRFLSKDGVTRLQGVVGPLLAISLVLVLAVHVPGLGVSVNGAKRWLGRGSFVFQPSELLKLALVLYAATVIARKPQRVHDLKRLVKPLLLVVGAAVLLVASQPDIGTGMVIACTIAAMLVAAGIPMRNLAIIAGVVGGAVLLFAIAEPYARERLTSFINPWAHPHGSGFQAVQGQIAVGSGGLFGVGPGQSVQKIFYLPEAPTDFILAVIGEELGVLGICGLLGLYGLIAYAGLRAARGARSLHAGLIAVGITSMIVCEATLNVFSVLGLAPLTGVPLPFVSYGASDLIVMLAAMGILMNIAAGGSAHVRSVDGSSSRARDARTREQARLRDERAARTEDPDRSRRHGGARRAGDRGRR